MGYLCVDIDRGTATLDALREHSEWYVGSKWTSGSNQCEVVQLATGADAVYGVLQVTQPSTGAVHRVAMVIKVERHVSSGRVRFCWKDMSEADHPFYYGMSKRMLDSLTPVDIAYADCSASLKESVSGWRAKVRAHHDAKAAAKAKMAIVKQGVKVRFPKALTFNLPSGPVKTASFQVYSTKPLRFMALSEEDGSALFSCAIRRKTLQNEDWQVQL